MVDQMEGLFLFAGLFSVVLFLVPTGLLLGLLVVFALRTDADDAGGRASALYLSMASFVALFTLLAAAFALTTSIVDLVSGDDGSGESSGFTSFEPDGELGFEAGSEEDFSRGFGGDGGGGQDADDRAISAAVASAIVALVAGAIVAFHLPRLDRLGAAHQAGTSAWRVRRSFRLVTCLAAVLIVLVTASLSLYGVYSMAAPGVAGAGDRGDALEGLIPVLVLLGGAGLIFWLHWDDERPPPVTSAVAP
jgi:hypothetical protein